MSNVYFTCLTAFPIFPLPPFVKERAFIFPISDSNLYLCVTNTDKTKYDGKSKTFDTGFQ